MNIFTILNKPISSNCFVIYKNKKCIIVDPGDIHSIELDNFIKLHRLVPEYIILTHEHYDHIEGCNYLRLVYPNIKLIASEACNLNIQDERWNLSRFKADDGIGFTVSAADILIDKEKQLDLLGLNWHFLLTPGHSQGSMCFWCENFFFSGDMLIPGEKTVLKLKGSNKKDYANSITKMRQVLYSGSFTILPGHKERFENREVIL